MNKNKICILFFMTCLFVLLAGCGSSKNTDSDRNLNKYQNEPIGIDGYLAMDRLAVININSYPYGVSSAGRTNVNSDGFDGQNWLYIDDNGDHVICEAKGKGVVNKIWTTGTYKESSKVKIYIDNEETPVYSDYYLKFTNGKREPFLYPVTKNWLFSAGGRVNYLPIPFGSYLKIAIEDPGDTNLFWYVDYEMLESDYEVTPFTSQEDISALLQMWNDVGVDFKSDIGVVERKETHTLGDGEAYSYFNAKGSKQIQSIRITIPGLELPDTYKREELNASTNLREELNGLRLKIYWDGETSASVDCSLASFFGMGAFGYNNAVHGLFYGVQDGVMYNYFPMPFKKSANLVVENSSGETIDVTVEVRYKDVDYTFSNVGYFKTCEKNFYVNAADPLELCLLSEKGSGKVVSIQMNCFGDSRQGVKYEEGDVRVYIDGSYTPQIVSPGMEDFFNGAGYFLDYASRAKYGLYTTQLSGYTNWHVSDENEEGISVYRVFANDAITFHNGIHFCIEHGGGDRDPNATSWHKNQSAGYETLICYYHTPVQRMEETDSILVTDQESFNAHNFAAEGEIEKIAITSGFASGFDLIEETLYGIAHSEATTFEMALNADNYGAVLCRVFDYATANIGASVYVDGEYAGEWYKAGYNDVIRFCEDRFIIPSALTVGKEKITVRIVPNEGDSWTVFKYSVQSIVDKAAMEEDIASGDVINIFSGEKALTVSDESPVFANVDNEGRSDFRLLKYHDGSYFILNSYNGSVLASVDGKPVATQISTEKLDEHYRWVMEKTEEGISIKNLGDSKYLTSQATLSDDGNGMTIRFVTQRRQNIF